MRTFCSLNYRLRFAESNMTNIPSGASDWKNHPVIVAAAAFAAGLGFAYQFMFPVLTASLQTEIGSLKRQNDEITSLKSRASSLEAQVRDEQTKLAIAQQSNTFSLSNPYPVGLGQIKLGDNVEDLTKFFPAASVTEKRVQAGL